MYYQSWSQDNFMKIAPVDVATPEYTEIISEAIAQFDSALKTALSTDQGNNVNIEQARRDLAPLVTRLNIILGELEANCKLAYKEQYDRYMKLYNNATTRASKEADNDLAQIKSVIIRLEKRVESAHNYLIGMSFQLKMASAERIGY